MKDNHSLALKVGSVCTSCLSVLSHPASAAMTLFGIILYQQKKISNPIPVISGAFVTVLLLIWAYPQAPQLAGIGQSFDLFYLVKIFLRYMGRLWTTTFIIFPDLDQAHVWDYLFGITTCLAIVYVVYKKITPDLVAFVWIILMIFPFVNNSFHGGGVGSGPSRFLYWASAGTSLLIARWIISIFQRFSVSQFALHITIGFLVCWSAYSLRRSEAISLYKSGRSLFAIGNNDAGVSALERAIAQEPFLIPRDAYVRLTIPTFSVGKPPQEALQKIANRYPEDIELQMLILFCQTLSTYSNVRASIL